MFFSHLDYLYLKSDIVSKEKSLVRYSLKNWSFDGFSYRLTQLNEAVQLIFNLGKDFRRNGKGQSGDFSAMSLQVTPQRLELWTR